jgi:hypothetical protein
MSANLDKLAKQEAGLLPGGPTVQPVEPTKHERILDSHHLARLIEDGYRSLSVVEDPLARHAHGRNAAGLFQMNIWGATLVGLERGNVGAVAEWSRQACARKSSDPKAFSRAISERLGMPYETIVWFEISHENVKLDVTLKMLQNGKLLFE